MIVPRMAQEDIEFLKNQTDFGNLSEKELEKLLKVARKKRLVTGQLIFDQADLMDRIYCIKSGHIKGITLEEDGEYSRVSFLLPSNIFPFGGLLKGSEHEYSARAICNAEVFIFPIKLVRRLLNNNPKFMYASLHRYELILSQTETLLRRTVNSCARLRVEKALYTLRDHFAEVVDENQSKLPFKLQINDIAILSGTTRETVSSVVRDLKEEQCVSYEQKFMFFRNQSSVESD